MRISLEAFRLLFGFSPSPPRAKGATGGDRTLVEGQDQKPATDEAIVPKQQTDKPGGPSSGTGMPDKSSPDRAGLLSAYLSARVEETLALLLEGLAGETSREMRQVVEETGQSISAEIAEVREGVDSSQREFSRIGREMVRSGAALESIRDGVSTIGPTMERLETALREHLASEKARAEEELAGPDEILATLDGLENGLQEGREMVSALASIQDRLKDTTTQRWWRAMGEATGVKRPLPEIPLADVESLVTGLELTYRRLQDALARHGVTAIEAVGKPFDPYVHEAVAVEPCPEEQDGLVLREQRRGYRTTDRVIRLSQVVVGRGEPSEAGTRRSHETIGGAKVSSRARSASRNPPDIFSTSRYRDSAKRNNTWEPQSDREDPETSGGRSRPRAGRAEHKSEADVPDKKKGLEGTESQETENVEEIER